MDVEDEELRDVENVKYVNEMQDGENAVFKASNNSIYHPVAATASYRAYYPYKGDTNNKIYNIDVSDQTDLSKIDLITSENISKTYNNSKLGVDFSFKHQLSLVSITINNGNGLLDSDIENISAQFTGLKLTGGYDLTADNNPITLTGAITPLNLNVTSSAIATIEAVIIPQSGEGVAVKFTTQSGEEYIVAIPKSTIFESGKSYSYNITLNEQQSTIASTSITDWVSGNGSGENLSNSNQSSESEPSETNATINLNNTSNLTSLKSEISKSYASGARKFTFSGEFITGMLGDGTSSTLSPLMESAPEVESLDFSSVTNFQLTGYAFKSSSDQHLVKILLPSSITTIPDNAFADCEALTSLTLENATSFGSNIFANCSSLTTLQLLSKDITINSVNSNTFDSFTPILCTLTLNKETNLSISDNKICFGNIEWLIINLTDVVSQNVL